ncbi:hypothetical protein DM01DRAFT_108552 [Hesseltinella vesiculosa]|uniref:Uncharacterized protein n=1 Tax=Hesseltinella vesiculosa TaxID=101127 RepID=A0A1X2GG27_9FUNG|nr:hypothetical protein DM01DRAFT_108552 [Hesseltinella vesiculosa]
MMCNQSHIRFNSLSSPCKRKEALTHYFFILLLPVLKQTLLLLILLTKLFNHTLTMRVDYFAIIICPCKKIIGCSCLLFLIYSNPPVIDSPAITRLPVLVELFS